METYGKFSDGANAVIKKLGKMFEDSGGGDASCAHMSRSSFVDYCRERLSITLQKAISSQIHKNYLTRVNATPKDDDLGGVTDCVLGGLALVEADGILKFPGVSLAP